MARGLSGALIVDQPDSPDVNRDEVLVLDDWLLDLETGGLVEPFTLPKAMSHGGRTGNLVGVNGRFDFSLTAQKGERLRLRLNNAANARFFSLRLQAMAGWMVALDGTPLDAPAVVAEEITVAPAQCVDLIVDITTDKGAHAEQLT
ncbi:hypothetical protein [Litorisediminicola beolgyonensis]|uniref:Plastocyanin-like domain-containing protein n=1 Tax=Litorisediminicola beolgyonensis TaxID=1173614 RepID=A0ABW3ZM37_9RHOB